MKSVHVRVPATTANLGPGFDCLGLALELWNQAAFTLDPHGIEVSIEGEGAGDLPRDETNQVAQAALALYQAAGAAPPPGLKIHCENRIPLGSGLGSSSAAVLTGLLGANTLLGNPLSDPEVLALAAAIEGHPDNAAPALLGGLVIAVTLGALADEPSPRFLTRGIPIPPLSVAVAVPKVNLSTRAARAVLPAVVPLGDAVFNIGRAALVVEALRTGDLALLGEVMEDRLHQPYRLALIPGAAEAVQAARAAGAAAVALSGAGPGIVAFPKESTQARVGELARRMAAAFARAGVDARAFPLAVTIAGAEVQVI